MQNERGRLCGGTQDAAGQMRGDRLVARLPGRATTHGALWKSRAILLGTSKTS